MHPAVLQFIDQLEEEARRQGQYRSKLGKYERKFLNEVWGPMFQYNFVGLKAEYPLKDFKGGDRFVDFAYIKGGIRLIIEIDGFTTHAREISPGDFDDHLMRQNDLILSGWIVLRFSVNQVEKRSTICQRQIIQAIGHWWTFTQGTFPQDKKDIWNLRRKWLTQLALRRDGVIRIKDVADEFGITPRAALYWLSRYTADRTFSAVRPQERTIGYRLNGYVPVE